MHSTCCLSSSGTNALMPEIKDPAFKLFGATIPVPAPVDAGADVAEDREQSPAGSRSSCEGEDGNEDLPNEIVGDKEKDPGVRVSEDPTEPKTPPPMSESPKIPSVDKETSTSKSTKEIEKEQSETGSLKEKALKKPDKILPCPRCNSEDTKFCYYNNYNVNQPRHFCRNCQRYWTAGGTMRNVPVGAGRRKNKNCTSHIRHLNVPDPFQLLRTDPCDSMHNPPSKPNARVLNFGSDSPLCESMSSVLNLAENSVPICSKNGLQTGEEVRYPVSCGVNSGEEHSAVPSVSVSHSMEAGFRSNLQIHLKGNCQAFPPQAPYFAGPPWNCTWDSAQWRSPPPTPFLPLAMTPNLPPSPFCAPSFPMPFYPATPYWGCALPGAWSVPWPAPPSSSPSAPNTASSSGSESNSPKLGKHSREGNTAESGNENTAKQRNTSLWIPKTLRVDGPDEAARSSIWSTLGIKDEKADTVDRAGIFKAFHTKSDDKNQPIDGNNQVLRANPAAFSRSLNFHESS